MKEEENVIGEGEYNRNYSIFGKSENFVSKFRVRSKKKKKGF
jgi:hypothetical protein